MAAKGEWKNTLVIPSSKRLASIAADLDGRLERERVLSKVLAKAKKAFDFVLIDLPSSTNIMTVNALVAADSYLIPTDLSEWSRQAITTINTLADKIRKKLNPKLKFSGAVVVRYQKAASGANKVGLENLALDLSGKLLEIRINDSVRVLTSQAKNVPIAAVDPLCQVSQSYENLSKFIEKGSRL